jgi:putative peptide modification system cyclase
MSAISIEPNPNLKPGMPAPLLRTLAVCDLVDSTALTEKLGDRVAAELVHRLDRLTRDLLYRHGGREIDKTDGFLVMFERPIQAVGFALAYQRLLREGQAHEAAPLQARIGIHVGDVVLWENSMDDVSRGAKPVEVEGLVKPVAARLMSLALPGQILLSAIAYTFALRAQDELGLERPLPEWRAHGRYQFKGLAEPMTVYEVGERGIAPLHRPTYSGKAHREVPWWRRPGVLALEVIVLIAAIAVPAYISIRSPPAIAFANRDWVVAGNLKNLTGQSVLDDSLDTAFRVSLEQSRYVNLIPTLQTRDALTRMRRPPDTKIDRVLGSEIALREGARALILPSVAEIGGQVRVTIEVIDPHNQATVYVETAEGVGIESILPSIGKVSSQLRGRLGEALTAVEANSAPLPKVTTANLDALRAYSLGLKAYINGHKSDAVNLYEQATKFDPDFALAYIGLARVYAGSDDAASAQRFIARALSLKDRLSARDQLYLDAWAASSGPPGPMLKKWQLLGEIYPDHYAAAYNYAYFAWNMENRAQDAITAIQPALSEHDLLRAGAYNTLAFFQIAENQFDAAEKNFRKAADLGDNNVGEARAAAYGAQRHFGDAERVLDNAKPTGIPATDLNVPLERVVLDIDQGNWRSTPDIVGSLVDSAAKVGPFYGRIFRAIQLSLGQYLSPKPLQIAALKSFIAEARTASEDASDPNHHENTFALLFGAYLAARADDYALAETVLTAATPQARDSGFPNLEHMLAIVEAELSAREGRPQDAIARLRPTLDGRELYLTHVALADAYTAAGRNEDAIEEALWLTRHRGRAYVEANSHHMLQALNVAESDIALLRSAELNARLGKPEQSAKAVHDFLSAWPNAQQTAALSSRLNALKP